MLSNRSSYPDFDPDSEQMDADDGSESAQSDSLDGSGYELVLPSGWSRVALVTSWCCLQVGNVSLSS